MQKITSCKCHPFLSTHRYETSHDRLKHVFWYDSYVELLPLVLVMSMVSGNPTGKNHIPKNWVATHDISTKENETSFLSSVKALCVGSFPVLLKPQFSLLYLPSVKFWGKEIIVASECTRLQFPHKI